PRHGVGARLHPGAAPRHDLDREAADAGLVLPLGDRVDLLLLAHLLAVDAEHDVARLEAELGEAGRDAVDAQALDVAHAGAERADPDLVVEDAVDVVTHVVVVPAADVEL